MRTEIRDLEGVQKRYPPYEDQHKKIVLKFNFTLITDHQFSSILQLFKIKHYRDNRALNI